MNRIKNASKQEIEEEKKVKKKSKLKRFIVIVIVIAIIYFAITTAISINKWQTIAKEMVVNEPSQVLDTSKEVIAKIGSEKNRENISSDKISDNLKNAYVAIEDERFYKHCGIDVKRTSAAIVSYVIHFGKASYGGSTITQQLVKNVTGDDSNTISRKVKEWAKAIELEWCMDKDEILENYLNIIYVGPNVYGVQKGAEYYFNKDAQDLTLEECAFLAGINNSPNSYNPFNKEKDNTEKITKRTKTVLSKMLELGYITEDECNEAKEKVDSGLKFDKGDLNPESNGVFSYHTDALISDLVTDISDKKNISKAFATNYLNMANLKVYSTQDSDIQEKLEKEFENNKYKLTSTDGKATSQAAMVIMDHKTGQVVASVGGLGKKTEIRGFNRATQAVRQTGSSSKPLAVILPSLAEGIITPVTTYVDEPTTFIDYNNEEYSPTDYNNYLGEITVRRAVESSQNIPFVKMMEELTPGKSLKYLKKMGITTLTEKDENLSLALGGLDKGISPLEMAAAYCTIANDGVYIEPTFYSKVTTTGGTVVLEASQKKRRVCSESVAYVTKQLLTQPIIGNNGTAVYCAIPGMDVSAKTGTTNEDYDRWLCGFTNYYTAVTWFGFDMSETINYNGKNPAGFIWSAVMKNIHTDLENSSFEKPGTVVAREICKDTWGLANSGCKNTYTEYFLKGNLPDKCTKHSGNLLNSTNITIDENTKNKLKDLIKDTAETVVNQIEDEEDINIPSPTKTQNNTSTTSESTTSTTTTTQTPEVVEETVIESTNTDNYQETTPTTEEVIPETTTTTTEVTDGAETTVESSADENN